MENNRKQIFLNFLLISAFFLASVIAVIAFPNQKNFYGSASAEVYGSEPALFFSPSSFNVRPGDEFTVEINLITAGKLIGGAAIQVLFDSNAFQVKELIPGKSIIQTPPMLPAILRQEIDNQVGKVYLDAAVNYNNPEYYSGRGIFAKIRFAVKNSASPGSKIISLLFNPNQPQLVGDTDIIGNGDLLGKDILKQTGPLTVVVAALPTPTLPPPTPTPPAVTCLNRGGTCCLGGYGGCTGGSDSRLINPWVDPTSGNCNPGGDRTIWCCLKEKCVSPASPVAPTKTPTVNPPKPTATVTPLPQTPTAIPTVSGTSESCLTVCGENIAYDQIDKKGVKSNLPTTLSFTNNRNGRLKEIEVVIGNYGGGWRQAICQIQNFSVEKATELFLNESPLKINFADLSVDKRPLLKAGQTYKLYCKEADQYSSLYWQGDSQGRAAKIVLSSCCQ